MRDKALISIFLNTLVALIAVYPARAQTNTETITIYVEGVVCQGCSASIMGALAELDGVVYSEDNLTDGSVTVVYIPDLVTPQQMVDTISTQTAFSASLSPFAEENIPALKKGWVGLGVVVTIILLVVMMAVSRRRLPSINKGRDTGEQR